MANDNFDPLWLTEQLASEHSDLAKERRVTISSFCMPELPAQLNGDVKIVREILQFLLRAVFERTNSGGIIVEAMRALPTSAVRFGVSTSISNLVEDDLNRIVDGLLEEKVDGSTCADLLESLGSELLYDSTLVGRAARLFFELPNAVAEWEPAPFPIDEALLGPRLFLVSNDPPPNRVIQSYCRFYGLRTEGAPTATESLSVIAEAALHDPFKVVGIAPPIEDMTPCELVKAIRESDLPQPKIYYVAPFDDEDDLRTSIEAGFDAYLVKPVKKHSLFNVMTQLVKEAPAKPRQRPVVLIVDDNPVNQKVAMFQVRALGLDALFAADGKEAVEACKKTDFAAVLMDIQMPIMDGIEATKRIRAAETGGKRVPIIAVTANDHYAEKAKEVGMDDFLVKPVKKERIAQALARVGVLAA
jgi:two-component system sensor histidine kinase/response regulator